VSDRVVIEADGGSRANPGPAGYGAVVFDQVSGTVLAERSAFIGVATNNVAEYRGAIAGLTAALRIEEAGVEHDAPRRRLGHQNLGLAQIGVIAKEKFAHVR